MLKKIFSSAFIRNVSVLVTGTVIAQVISIMIQPVLRRYFDPEAFGAFDIYYKILGFICLFLPLSYDYAIVLPKRKISSVNVAYSVMFLSLVLFLISEILVIIFHENLVHLLRYPTKYGYALYLVPLSALFFAFSTTISYLLIREKKFSAISLSKIGRRGMEGVIQVGIGLTGNSVGLFLGDLFGNIANTIISLRLYNFDNADYKKNISFSLFIKVLKKYFYITKINFIPNLLNTIAISSITFIVLFRFDVKIVGYLELTQKILIVPTALVGMAVSQVILETVSSAFQQNLSFMRKIIVMFLLLLALGLLYFVVIFFFGEFIFTLFFGENWRISGVYAEVLIFGTFFSMIVSPFGNVLRGINNFKLNAFWMYIRVSIIGILFILPYKDINRFILIYTCSEIIVYVLYLFFIIKAITSYEKNIKDFYC